MRGTNSPFFPMIWLLLLALPAAAETPREIVVMLDNSGSMRKTDSKFLLRRIAEKFIRDADSDTHVALGVFGDRAELLIPLQHSAEAGKRELAARLGKLEYGSRYTNIPEALTKAMDELRIHGQQAASRSIVLLTDGTIDTGDRLRDRENEEWLREIVSGDLARGRIKLFSIALTDSANVELLMHLAEVSNGAFFLARHVPELADILAQIDRFSRFESSPTVSPYGTKGRETSSSNSSSSPSEMAPDGATRHWFPDTSLLHQEPGRPATVEALNNHWEFTQRLTDISSHVMRFLPVYGSLIVALGGLGLARFFRRRTPKVRSADTVSAENLTPDAADLGAYLTDINGVTGRHRHNLNDNRIMLGRVAPFPEEQMQGVVIDLPTIGRRHALIELRKGGYWVVDQGSKNGTFVNNRRVRDAVYLMHGDTLRLHNIEFEFALRGMSYADITLAVDEPISARPQVAADPQVPEAPIYASSAVTEGSTEAGGPDVGSAQIAKQRLFAEVARGARLQQ